jgi:hypothetical protein
MKKTNSAGRVLARTLAIELKGAKIAGLGATASMTILGGSGKYDSTNDSWDADSV